MKPYKIFSDSSCDLTPDLLEKYSITAVPFYVSFDQENYMKENIDISISDFYIKLQTEKIYPKTSLPSVEDYIQHFEKAINEGFDILCLNISSKFSGSHQSAMTAKSILMDKYPDSKIEVIDSYTCTGAQASLLVEMAKMRDLNMTIEENVANVTKVLDSSRLMLTLGTLDYLQKGGRIGKASALAGGLLNLKPLIIMEDGELFPYGKVRGYKKAIEKLYDMVEEHFKNNSLNYDDYEFCVITGTNFEEATKFAEKLKDIVKKSETPRIHTLGTTIGTYTGPDIVGVCFIRRCDV